jgi:DNA-binding CsgD family transcriptional regulator
MIVGRPVERARIDEAVASLREGHGQALLVSGEAGIGKSALLDYAADRAARLQVLRAQGVETERDLAFSGLHELLHPLLAGLHDLPQRQCEALRGALALGPAVGDRFAVHAGTLTLLAGAAERQPVLVVVDDLQLLDQASLEAVSFAARRLTDDPVALIFGARETEHGFPSLPKVEELCLAGLAVDDAMILLEDRSLAPSVAAQLVTATGGNPLALIELPSLLDERVLRGDLPLPEPLPTTPSIKRAFRGRHDALPAEARTAVLLAAALGGGDVGPVKRALEAAGIDSGAALEIAEGARLIRLDRSRFAFVHPLARSALYEVASPGERREAHAALADVLVDEDEADRRAWHLGEAAIGPDEDVASVLESSADRALARGGFAAASSALERAAELSESSAGHARRLTAAANAAQLAGAGDRALNLLGQALRATSDETLKAEIQNASGFISFWRGDLDAAKSMFAEATRLERTDPARAAVIYAELTGPCFMRGDPAGFLEMGERALELSEPDGGFSEFMGVTHWGLALMYSGRVAESRPYLLRGAEIAERNPGALDDPIWPAIAAGALAMLEEEDRGRALLNRLIGEARATSSFGVLTFLLPVLAGIERDAGDWQRAGALAVECVELSRDTGQATNLLNGLNECALLEARRGNEGLCERYAREALELAGKAASLPDSVYAHEALGVLALGLGRAEQAVASLEPVVLDVLERGIGEPQLVGSVPNLIEAYVRVGRTDEATDLLGPFEGLASDSQLAWELAPAARCRGLLASDDEFEAAFLAGLAECERISLPFEQGRIELCLGERLRRAGRRIDARVHLRSALSCFERLGAVSWTERSRSELRASGETIRSRVAPASRETLTPQELKVALVVAEGLSNREAATALFLSPKTIEAHLGRVYRKLGIRSRSQLARAFADGPAATVEELQAERGTLAS